MVTLFHYYDSIIVMCQILDCFKNQIKFFYIMLIYIEHQCREFYSCNLIEKNIILMDKNTIGILLCNINHSPK